MLRPSDHTLYDDTLTDLLSMIIDSVKVAAKEIVVSLSILPSHSPSLPESIVRQVVWVTAYQTSRIRGSPGGWLDFSDDQPDFIRPSFPN